MGVGRAIALNVGRPAAMTLQRPGLYLPTMPAWRVAPRQQGFLPIAIIALKVIASGLAGATVTVMLWPSKPVVPYVRDVHRFGAAFAPYGETTVYRTAPVQLPAADAEPFDASRGVPENFPRRVEIVRFRLPPALSLASRSRAIRSSAGRCAT
jgi:hypothetical protein